MFFGAYRFSGSVADLVPAYDRLLAGMPSNAISLHVCVVEDDAITIFDACPTRAVFMEFSSGPAFAAAVAAAGLPAPAVTPLGIVHTARHGDTVISEAGR